MNSFGKLYGSYQGWLTLFSVPKLTAAIGAVKAGGKNALSF
jgi:hypothetical protein